MTNIGMIDFGVTTDVLSKEWKNPYDINNRRKDTKVNEYGAYLGYGIPTSEHSFAMLRYKYAKKDYKSETVQDLLKREGTRKILSFENMYENKLFSKKTMLFGNLNYEKYDAKGDASSYKLSSFEFGVQRDITDKLDIMLMGNIGTKKFEKYNPILNKKINTQNQSFMAIVKYKELFEYKDLYLSLKFGYEKEDANHNFYDKESKFGVFSLGYTF